MTALRIAGWSNLLIGLLHIAALPWERRMSYWVGIGPSMDRLERMHFLLPYALWIATAAAFGACGLYTLSAAGSFRSLPFAKAAIVAIACIYVLRAVGGTGMGGFLEDASAKEAAFSTIALGVLYAVGAWSLFRTA
jgi:hypothetical protein